MYEPATTLTDYLLAAECAWFAQVLAGRAGKGTGLPSGPFVALFVSVAVAAVAGGTVHGFFPDQASAGNRFLWSLTLLSIGGTAAAMVAVSLRLAAAPDRSSIGVAALGWVGYATIVLFVSREFIVAIIAYLPAAVLLLAALGVRRARGRPEGTLVGGAGVLLALVGAAGQQAGVGIHPLYFDHNAIYHVAQMVTLALLFRAALALCAEGA